MHKLILLSIVLFPGLSRATGQVIEMTHNQPPLLVAEAGHDTLMCSGHTLILGGDPTAIGGSGPYFYQWLPQEGLDNPTTANPEALITQAVTYTVQVSDAHGCTMTDQITILTDPCLGTLPESLSDRIAIYPNPTSGRFMLKGLSGIGQVDRIEMLNHLGQILKSWRLSGEFPDGEIELDAGSVESGLCILRLYLADRVLSYRLLIR